MNTADMTSPVAPPEQWKSRDLTDAILRIAFVGFLTVECFLIFRPFLRLTLWSIVLAVALYPLHVRIVHQLGGRSGRAATLFTLVLLLCVLIPATLLAVSFADSTAAFVTSVKDGSFQIPPPPDSVAGWPVIGGRLHDAWAAAHDNIGSVAKRFETKIYDVTKEVLGYATSAGTGMLKFLVALVVAGIWMGYGVSAQASATAIARRMFGVENGVTVIRIATTTIRAVAQGVVGIACVQALLLGAGFIMAGIPAAGILALGVLLLGIAQVPALLIVLPTIGYVFYTQQSTAVAIMFSVYFLVAGAVDNVLKPLMLGRGAAAPMPVILLGALGGLAAEGIIGLFLGAVLLALGYQLLMAWVYGGEIAGVAAPEETG